MIAGNKESINKFVIMGAEEVNKYKLYIKFICTERKEITL